jgi:hypothetical protein
LALLVVFALVAAITMADGVFVAMFARTRENALRHELHAALGAAVRLVTCQFGMHRADEDDPDAFRHAMSISATKESVLSGGAFRNGAICSCSSAMSRLVRRRANSSTNDCSSCSPAP